MDRAAENLLETILAQQRALLEVARMEEPDSDAKIRRILELSAETLGVERVGFWEYAPDRAAIVCRKLYLLSAGEHSGGAVLLASNYPRYFRALAEHLVVPADDARVDPRTSEYSDDYLEPNGIGAMMDVPIWMRGEVHGILCHEHVGGPRHWYAGEQLFAAAMANFVTVALETRRASAETTRLKRSILDNLSHEVRTPLNLILGNVELVRDALDGPARATVSPMLDIVHRAGRRENMPVSTLDRSRRPWIV